MEYNKITEDEMALLEADLHAQQEADLKQAEWEAVQLWKETYWEKVS